MTVDKPLYSVIVRFKHDAHTTRYYCKTTLLVDELVHSHLDYEETRRYTVGRLVKQFIDDGLVSSPDDVVSVHWMSGGKEIGVVIGDGQALMRRTDEWDRRKQ